ncbi:MAG: phenylalanine--tRNA ligase subunit beta [Candidatus Pacebacteria bacterium]|nr:phenylalanine--tRNA ligase subunit beta [Candidatus Paceibacterota bacterium]MBP9842525.1 phenylalanine--tRNA ligase subunit beta [Candidatus Paceibacterota bacterium]
MKVVHSWLKDYLGDALPTSAQVEELLTFHSFEIDGLEEVIGETVIDVSVLPNRASDCLCHRGIARELAALLDVSLVHDPLSTKPELVPTNKIAVDIQNEIACPRFTAALVTGVTVGESPAWLKKRLNALGVRSINNIVDATNYVMYALGEPMHAYDADLFPQVDGKWRFVVRDARAGETISLLAEGGKDEDRIVELIGTELLIVDGSSDTPIGLAGVKGGRYAGVHAGTKNIIIEAAHFHPTITRKTARRLGIVIDASKRFENEPSRELPPYAQAEIVKLIADIAGGTFEGWVDKYKAEKQNPEVVVPVAQTNALLGLKLPPAEMKNILHRIGARIVSASTDSFIVVGPWERNDLTIAEDFIEEIGRIHGLHNVVSVHPEQMELPSVSAKQYVTEAVRQELLQAGFSEVITSSFTNKADIQLQNSLAADKTYVRNSLSKSIAKVLDANFTHTDLLGISDVRVFEIGTVFDKTETSVSEHTAIALGVRTKGNGYNPKDDAILKTACETVEQILGTKLEWQTEKGVAEANLSEILPSILVPSAYPAYISKTPATYKPVSIYPAMSRDIALWVGEGEMSATVESTILQAAGNLCVRLSLFDTFTKDGRTSYAFRLVFQSFEKTLTDEEVTIHMDAVYKAVAERGWEVR